MRRKKIAWCNDYTVGRIFKMYVYLDNSRVEYKSSFTKLTLDDDNAKQSLSFISYSTLPPVCLSYNLAYTSGYDNYYVMRMKQVWIMKKKLYKKLWTMVVKLKLRNYRRLKKDIPPATIENISKLFYLFIIFILKN